MEYVKGGLKRCDEYRSVLVPATALVFANYCTKRPTNPIACVWQSAAGAKEVTGSKIVRADICSEVDGSKRMIDPPTSPIPG